MFLKPITKAQYLGATGEVAQLTDDKGSPTPPTTITELEPSKIDPTVEATSPVPKPTTYSRPTVSYVKPTLVETTVDETEVMQTKPLALNVNIDNVPLVSELYPSGKENIVTGVGRPMLAGGSGGIGGILGGGGGGAVEEEEMPEKKKFPWWIIIAGAGGAFAIYKFAKK